MRLRFHKKFQKHYQKLTPKLQKKTIDAIEQFKQDPQYPGLRNHPLHGDMLGRRSFSVAGDIRIIFSETHNYERVTLLDVGTHNQVYK